MPGPAAVVATLAKLVGISGVSVSAELISLGFTIADHLKAQEGLKSNLHAFKLDVTSGPQSASQPASASIVTLSGGKSAAVPKAAGQPSMRLRETGNSVAILEIRSNGARAVFGLDSYLRVAPSGPSTLVYLVHLWDAKGFDSEVGDQAELEFSGTEVDDGYLLSVKGFVNEWLRGFFHFYGDILIRRVAPGSLAESVLPLRRNTVGTGGRISETKHGFLVVTF